MAAFTLSYAFAKRCCGACLFATAVGNPSSMASINLLPSNAARAVVTGGQTSWPMWLAVHALPSPGLERERGGVTLGYYSWSPGADIIPSDEPSWGSMSCPAVSQKFLLPSCADLSVRFCLLAFLSQSCCGFLFAVMRLTEECVGVRCGDFDRVLAEPHLASDSSMSCRCWVCLHQAAAYLPCMRPVRQGCHQEHANDI